MKKRFFLSLVFLICLGSGAGWAATTWGAGGSFEAKPAAAAGSSQPTVEVVLPTETAVIPIVAVPEQALSPVAMVESLNAQAVARLKAGWLHVAERITFDTDQGNNGVLPNGMAIPLEQVNDLWYHLNEEGWVIEVVSIMRNQAGEIVQVGVSSDGTGWNSATGEVDSGEQWKLEGLDGGFIHDLTRLSKSDARVEYHEIVLPGGGRGVEFVIHLDYDPVSSIDYKLASIAGTTRAVFDYQTGCLVSLDIIFAFEDGSERMFKHFTQQIAFAEPTDEVLGYLALKAEQVKP